MRSWKERGAAVPAPKRKKQILRLAALTLAAVLCCSACGSTEDAEVSPSEEEQQYLTYKDEAIPVLPDVPVNPYDIDQFTLDEDGMRQYSGEGYTSMLGIDVSSHQGEVDWQQVAEDGVEFVMLRLGYRGYGTGSVNLDSRFEENVVGAVKAGLHVGVYFFSQAVNVEEALEEADFVLAELKPFNIDLPVAFDWETIGTSKARTDDVTGEELTKLAEAFCSEIEQAGYESMIYFYLDLGYKQYDLSALTDYQFWLCEYARKPSFYYTFSMWQYSKTGTFPGISGQVDLNLYITPTESDSEETEETETAEEPAT